MKKKLYHYLSLLAITAFSFYWLTVFILSVPGLPAGTKVSQLLPHFSSIFTSRWKLFTPINTNQYRLYFIVRDDLQTGMTDTIEVLEKIALNKQRAAPFNQRENIIDHCLYNQVTLLSGAVGIDKKKTGSVSLNETDSQYMAHAIANLSYSKKYQRCLLTLKNYGKLVLKENHITPNGKVIKIVIKEKQIPPFNEKNPRFIPGENIVFETNFGPL